MSEDIKIESSSGPAVSVSPNPIEMKVETNYAPVERKSTEMATTEPLTPELKTPEIVVPESGEANSEPITSVPAVDDKANELARERFREKLRADTAESELAKLRPAFNPSNVPDINDQKTWGAKYANEPNSLETFLKARDEWAENKGMERARQESSQSAEAERFQAMRADVARKEEKSLAKHPDYYAAIAPVAPIIGKLPILKQFIAERELGTEVAYQLAKNPAMLDQLFRMTPFAAGEFLFSLEGRLKAPVAASLTNAPEPIKPVGSREVSKPSLATLASKDINGYIALRNKQELARKRAH